MNWELQRDQMVKFQIKNRGIKEKRILDALLNVPRHVFVPEELRSESYCDHPLPIGLNQTILINFQADKEDPVTLNGTYTVFSHESESPLISVQFKALATESLNVQDCYVLEVYFANNIIPYHQPKDIEITKWALCLKTKGKDIKKWRLRFPIVGTDYIINDVTVYEIELEQGNTYHQNK